MLFTKKQRDDAVDFSFSSIRYITERIGPRESGTPNVRRRNGSKTFCFRTAGVCASCLAGMNPTPASYYHNMRDTADNMSRTAFRFRV